MLKVTQLNGFNAMRQMEYIAHATRTQATGSSSIPISLPTGTKEGDFMIAGLVSGNTSTSVNYTGPAGWTEHADTVSPVAAALFSKVASASEGATITFTKSTTTGPNSGFIMTFRNAALDVAGTAWSANSTGTISAPSITLTGPDSILFAIYGNNTGSDGSLYATPTGFTRLFFISNANTSAMAVFYRSAGAGATGTVGTTNSDSGNDRGILIGIRAI